MQRPFYSTPIQMTRKIAQTLKGLRFGFGPLTILRYFCTLFNLGRMSGRQRNRSILGWAKPNHGAAARKMIDLEELSRENSLILAKPPESVIARFLLQKRSQRRPGASRHRISPVARKGTFWECGGNGGPARRGAVLPPDCTNCTPEKEIATEGRRVEGLHSSQGCYELRRD